ncbi:MAG TPA: DUF3006 domain-containing protein [Chondromyces sp.]|nr:DUF3006 domain-containing protein [Chondromyces sp.]
MSSNKYTLDRYEGDVGVLLLKGDESQELLVSKDQLQGAEEGDILFVELGEGNEIKSVEILKEETKITKKMVDDLLERLKNKE